MHWIEYKTDWLTDWYLSDKCQLLIEEFGQSMNSQSNGNGVNHMTLTPAKKKV